MERLPNQNEPSPENERVIKKEEVVAILKEKGLEDEGSLALVVRWTEQQETLIESKRGKEGKLAAILFEIERSEIYIAVDDIEGSLECLDNARLQAQQEGEEELYDMIMKKMDEIEGV